MFEAEARCTFGSARTLFKSILLALTIVGVAGTSAARADACAPDAKTSLEISVSDIRAPIGNITITIYPGIKNRFLKKRGKISRLRVKAMSPVTIACMPVPSSGTYAVVLYHDENEDGEFNLSMIGVPQEGYGFSNNATGFLGPPSYDAVKFNAGEGITHLDISVRY